MLISCLLRRPDGFFASIASVVCMRQTYNKTFNMGLQRLIGTMAGGAMGYFALIFLQSIHKEIREHIEIVFAPLCVLFLLYLFNITNKQNCASIGCIVLLSIIVSHNKIDSNIIDTIRYVVYRTIDTSIGVIVAVLVDRLIRPNKQDI
jgi:uncharacterized membrane protein YgaE (UPF0421/DUF939 family)